MRLIVLERIVLALLLATGVLYIYGISLIQVPRLGDPIGPRAFPMVIGGLFLVLVVYLIARAALEARRGRIPKQETSFAGRHELKSLLAVVLTGAYFAVFELGGYVLSTFLYLAALICLLRPQKIAINIAVAACFSLGSYLLFAKLLGVRLPGFFGV